MSLISTSIGGRSKYINWKIEVMNRSEGFELHLDMEDMLCKFSKNNSNVSEYWKDDGSLDITLLRTRGLKMF
jgi:hypothetical protein